MNKIRIITLNSLNKVFVVEKELLHEDIIQEFKAFDWKKNIERIEKALKCKKGI